MVIEIFHGGLYNHDLYAWGSVKMPTIHESMAPTGPRMNVAVQLAGFVTVMLSEMPRGTQLLTEHFVSKLAHHD